MENGDPKECGDDYYNTSRQCKFPPDRKKLKLFIEHQDQESGTYCKDKPKLHIPLAGKKSQTCTYSKENGDSSLTRQCQMNTGYDRQTKRGNAEHHFDQAAFQSPD